MNLHRKLVNRGERSEVSGYGGIRVWLLISLGFSRPLFCDLGSRGPDLCLADPMLWC